MILAFKYRLYPNKKQVTLINEQLYEACKLYNAALEHRLSVYKQTGLSVTYSMQSSELKLIRADGNSGLANFSCSQDILRRLEKTFKSFFTRVKRGEKPGFPRFKPSKRFNSITFPKYKDGCKLNGRKLYLQGIGEINIRLHRPIPGDIRTTCLLRKNGKYYVCFTCDVNYPRLSHYAQDPVGIDVGIENFATLSDGSVIKNPRTFKIAKRRLRILCRSVSRKQMGSKSKGKIAMLVSKHYEKIANQRSDFLHKSSKYIVDKYGTIIIEDLNIRGLTRGMLSRSALDASWGIFFNFLSYKAEKAGRKFIKVDPRGTSQRCNNCGTTVRKRLSDRWHDCVCGESVHRDLNSAKEVLRLGTSLDALTYSGRNSVAS